MAAEARLVASKAQAVSLQERLQQVATALFVGVEAETVVGLLETLGRPGHVVGQDFADAAGADGELARVVQATRVGASAAAKPHHAIFLAAVGGPGFLG